MISTRNRSKRHSRNKIYSGKSAESGFSLLELLVVLVVLAIFVTISMFYYDGHRKLYRPDEQTLLITDIMQEAHQRSLTQRETMRVEINATDKMITLFDENVPNTPDDDSVVRAMSLPDPLSVTIGPRPGNITYNPEEPLPVPTAVFLPSVYTPSFGDSVCTLRFTRSGTVENAGNNSIATGATVTGSTVHIWSPVSGDPNTGDIVRAITIIGSSGTIRAWEFDEASEAANKWKDSRRAGTYAAN
jgi:prepilin-type N-terminal cleavage/methylation domain-containing protein